MTLKPSTKIFSNLMTMSFTPDQHALAPTRTINHCTDFHIRNNHPPIRTINMDDERI